MAERKRQQIKDRIEAGEARNEARRQAPLLDRAGETAIEAKDKLTAFAKEHPIATVAGGLALGVLISTLFRGSPTRKIGAKVGTRAAGLAAVGAELAMTFAQHALAAADDARRTGADRLGDFGETVADRARDGGQAAQQVARGAGKRISDALHNRFG